MSNVYAQYCQFIEQQILPTQNLSLFKKNAAYQEILEHVNEELGQQYFRLLKPVMTTADIEAFCKINDRYGSPVKHRFAYFLASPTSLRYLYHAHLILTHMQSLHLTSPHLVEIGGGYGGLCLALQFLQTKYNISIASYSIVDLEQPSKLQALYLGQFSISFPVHFHTADSYGKQVSDVIPTTDGLFLVANYSFTEISKQHQQQYMEHLFPQVTHGFISWNCPLFDFGKQIIRSEAEVPQTDLNTRQNLYVYF